jgi:lipid II:glycine glycyltransferase (peptidoglycan interpeptide bridge formation enzyme)
VNLRELSVSEFNFFVSNYPKYSIYQTEQYANAMEKQKYTSIYYGLEEDKKLYGATLVLIEKRHGFKYAYAPRGFLLDYTDKDMLKQFTNLIKKDLGKKGVIAIKINPAVIKETYNPQTASITSSNESETIFHSLTSIGFYHLGYNNFFEALKPRFEAILDTNIAVEQLFNNIEQETKEKISDADTSGLQVFQSTTFNPSYLFLNENQNKDEINFYQEMFYSFQDNLNFFYIKLDTAEHLKKIQMKYQIQADISNEANAKVFETRGSDNTNEINNKLQEESKLNDIKNELVYATNLLRDFPQGIIVGACITIKQKDTVYLLVDNYDPNYERLNAKYLLIWKLIEKYTNEGLTKFNLGGITNFSLEDNPYKELNDFKLSFGSIGYEYLGDFELITNKPLYVMYQNSSPFRNMLKK